MLKSKFNSVGGHEFSDISVTIPDQSISISEILNRYAVGRDVPVMRGAMYDEGDAFEEDPLRVPSNDIVDNDEEVQRISAMMSVRSHPMSDDEVEDFEKSRAPESKNTEVNNDVKIGKNSEKE